MSEFPYTGALPSWSKYTHASIPTCTYVIYRGRERERERERDSERESERERNKAKEKEKSRAEADILKLLFVSPATALAASRRRASPTPARCAHDKTHGHWKLSCFGVVRAFGLLLVLGIL